MQWRVSSFISLSLVAHGSGSSSSSGTIVGQQFTAAPLQKLGVQILLLVKCKTLL
jgi:hypothetical protein